MKIGYVFNSGRNLRLDAATKGDAPREFFLGSLEMRARGHSVEMFEASSPQKSGVVSCIVDSLLLAGYLPDKMDSAVLSALRSMIPQLNQMDCVVATTSGLGFGLEFLRRFGRFCAPTVTIHCGILNSPYRRFRGWLTNKLLSKTETVLYGDGELSGIRDKFPGGRDHIRVVQFGVDTDFWRPAQNRLSGNYILSIGNDGRRDYEMLIQVAERLPCEVKIVTRRKLQESLPENVTLVQGDWHNASLSDAEIRSMYHDAAAVIVPLKESRQPSGQSVALQAMACGRAVIVTRTGGFWEGEKLQHGKHLLLADQGVDEHEKAVKMLLSNPGLADQIGRNAREMVEKCFTIEQFSEGIEAACHAAARESQSAK